MHLNDALAFELRSDEHFETYRKHLESYLLAGRKASDAKKWFQLSAFKLLHFSIACN